MAQTDVPGGKWLTTSVILLLVLHCNSLRLHQRIKLMMTSSAALRNAGPSQLTAMSRSLPAIGCAPGSDADQTGNLFCRW